MMEETEKEKNGLLLDIVFEMLENYQVKNLVDVGFYSVTFSLWNCDCQGRFANAKLDQTYFINNSNRDFTDDEGGHFYKISRMSKNGITLDVTLHT